MLHSYILLIKKYLIQKNLILKNIIYIQKKQKKIQTITDEIKGSLINNNFTENNHKIKSKYFCIKKNIIKKHIFDLQTNNDLKVLKNNKVVYINKNILEALKTLKKLIL